MFEHPLKQRDAFPQEAIDRHTHNKALSVAAISVCNPDRLPVGINRGDAAPAPSGFAEIVGDDFPILPRGPMRLAT
jgi:hypothetical protein